MGNIINMVPGIDIVKIPGSDEILHPSNDEPSVAVNSAIRLVKCEGEELERDGNHGCTRASIDYYVYNATSRTDAMNAVMLDAPSEYLSMPLSSYGFEGMENDAMKITCSYEMEINSVADSSGSGSGTTSDKPTNTVSFDCTGGTRHVTFARKNTVLYLSNHIKSVGSFVGWNGKTGTECEVTGIDIPAANGRLSITKSMSYSSVSSASYQKGVIDLVGKINSNSFRGYDPGCVMFLGMSYSGDPEGKIDVTFQFQVQPKEKVIVGGKSYGTKMGFQAVWVIPSTETTSEKLNGLVDGVIVSDVVEAESFGKLGV